MNNPARLLAFVCEKYFGGAVDEIKEYSIAVHALGRPESFDPQLDTIVRVTAHALRKRLEDYYTSAGADHSVHICLPPGHYVPKFIHTSELEATTESRFDKKQNGQQEYQQVRPATQREEPKTDRVAARHDGDEPGIKLTSRTRMVIAVATAAIAVFVISGFVWKEWNKRSGHESSAQTLVEAAPGFTSGKILRVIMGNTSAPYIDRGGFSWGDDHFCSGGNSFSVTGHAIQGTEDPQLFASGRRGVFHCNFPVPSGIYEVHLLFAET